MDGQKRILVLCGGKFAFPSLQILAYEKFLCGIGVGKGNGPIAEALETESARNGMPFRSFPDKASLAGLRKWLDELQPDYIFSISFPFLIPEDALAFGAEKFLNFHPGPLPSYRGPMPIFEVLRYQEPETAISVHYLTSKFDDGDLLFADPVRIERDDTYGMLAVRLSERMGQVAQNAANMLQFGSRVPSQPQDESMARYFEKPEQDDTVIQWKRMPADEIVSLINACNPWNQGADAFLMGNNVKLVSASLSGRKHNDRPGKILEMTDDGALAVSCLNNETIEIHIIGDDNGILPAKRFAAARQIIGQHFN